jgi:molybdate transport system substrate-binding protein
VPVTVYAAASLRDVLPAIDSAPRYSFAASDDLAAQIREGAPADVYAAAAANYPTRLFAEGLVERPVIFASNRLVLIVPASNPAGIANVRDVARDGVKLVVAGEGVPAGDYTRRLLRALGLTGALENVVSNETDVVGVVGKVSLGEADAGFVYATDAASAGGAVKALEIPADAQPPIEYQIAVVTASTRKEAARAFVAKLTGDAGRSALATAGFVIP